MDLEVILNAGIPGGPGEIEEICRLWSYPYNIRNGKKEGEMGFYLNIYYATQQRDNFQLEFAIASIQIFCFTK